MAVNQIMGLDELNQKLVDLKKDFNESKALNDTCMKAAKLVAAEVRRNLKGRVTGALLKSVQAVRGKKAWKQGAAAIARINAWNAPHAHLVEEGTSAYNGLMKIPLAAVAPAWWAQLPQAEKIEAGKRGYLFIRHRGPVAGQHPFHNAVQAKLNEVTQVLRRGALDIILRRIRQ